MKNSVINKNLLLITFILFSACFLTQKPSSAQSDSIKSQILNYEDSKGEIISKGRKMILEKFLENDKKKVAEVFAFLLKEEDDDYVSFHPGEKWLLYYWLGQYDNVKATVLNLDSFYANPRKKILPARDVLFPKMKEKLSEQVDNLNNQVNLSNLENLEKDFLNLHLVYLLTDINYKENNQAFLNTTANKYLSSYPNSPFEDYIRQYIRYEFVQSKWGFGFDFFSGYGVFTGALQKNFKNNIPIGIAFDVSYKKAILYLRDYIGFSRTKDSIHFNAGVWRNNAQARVYLPEATLGFVSLDNKFIKVVPFAGVASTSISPTEYDRNKYPEYEDTELGFTSTYTIGLNIDLKVGRPKKPVVSMAREEAFSFLRIRYAYNHPNFNNKYNRFDGNFHYLVLGFGGFGRAIKRTL